MVSPGLRIDVELISPLPRYAAAKVRGHTTRSHGVPWQLQLPPSLTSPCIMLNPNNNGKCGPAGHGAACKRNECYARLVRGSVGAGRGSKPYYKDRQEAYSNGGRGLRLTPTPAAFALAAAAPTAKPTPAAAATALV